jgi:multiple sugar transport system ATP-binding protein
VATAAAMLGLTKHLDRKPGELSGGQRQRVAMGRAIVREPAVYLMDEPLSNLDAKLRVQMRAEVSRIQRQFGVTTVYVTHDQTEAMTMGDRVAVLRDGDLLQVAPPQQLYDHPANIFVAAFIGSPAMNLYQGTLSFDGTEVAIGSQPIPLPEIVQTTRPGLSAYRNGPIVVGIRPEDLSASKQLGPTIEGDVDAVETLGSELLVYFRIAAKRLHLGGADTADAEVIEDLGAGEVGAATMAAAVARIDRSVHVQAGRRQKFSVNPKSIHFFDVGSGAAIW